MAQEEVDEAQSWANDLENDEPEYYGTEDDAERKHLPEKPSVEQLRSALCSTRYDTSQALQHLANGLEEALDEIEKLKRHRHDTTKSYSGRPES